MEFESYIPSHRSITLQTYQWRIQMGAPPPPPNGSQFFRFDFYFAEKRPCRRLTPPPPTNREMLAMTVCARSVTVSSLLKTTAKCLPLADPRGAAGTRPTQTGPNSFVFTYVFTEKYPRWRSMSPHKGKSLTRLCSALN